MPHAAMRIDVEYYIYHSTTTGDLNLLYKLIPSCALCNTNDYVVFSGPNVSLRSNQSSDAGIILIAVIERYSSSYVNDVADLCNAVNSLQKMPIHFIIT